MGFWDKEELIGTVTKNKRGEVFQVRIVESERTYLDIRTMYPGPEGELLPGKGIALRARTRSGGVDKQGE